MAKYPREIDMFDCAACTNGVVGSKYVIGVCDNLCMRSYISRLD